MIVVPDFFIRSVYSWRAFCGRFFIISVVRPERPGALSYFMEAIAFFTSLKDGGFLVRGSFHVGVVHLIL